MMKGKKTPTNAPKTNRDGGIAEEFTITETKVQKEQPKKEKEIVYEKMIINIDEDLAIELDKYIAKEKANRTKIFDPVSGKEKKISKSLWVRNAIQEALKNQ